MSISDGLGPSIFLLKCGKGARCEGRDGLKNCLFPARFGIFVFDTMFLISTFPYFYLDLACSQLCFPPGKGNNRGIESTTGELFRNFSELENNFYYCSIDDFNQSSFILFFFTTETVNLHFDSPLKKDNQFLITEDTFTVEMATWNRRNLAALNKGNCEEHPRSNLAQNSNVPRSQEDYITLVSVEIEGRVTKKLSQEFSRTENRILGAPAQLDDSLMNPLIQSHSGTAPETSRNVFSISQGTNQDDSQSNPHPEAGLFNNQTTQNSGPEDRHDMATGVQRESVCGHDHTDKKRRKRRYFSG